MNNNFLGIFDSNKDYNNYNVCVVIYDRKDYLKVMNTFKMFNTDLEYWLSINWDNNFYDIMVFYKKEPLNYKSVYLLRTVNTPFKVTNKETGLTEPKGWFYDEHNKPVRYTGLGNSLYFSRVKEDKDFSEKALYLLYFCFMDEEQVDSNLESFSLMLSNIDFYRNSNTINDVQDNSLKTYEKPNKFQFGVIN